jgi:hypothetical protein
VTFLKTYDAAFRGYDAVQYAGEARNEGEEIEGRWTIYGRLSGSFLMIRSGPAPAQRAIRQAERIDRGR